MNHDVFISYSSRNSTAAQAICHELEDNGIKCWMAPRDIMGGKKYGDLIDDAIISCRVFLLIYSADSLASQWCNGELNVAFDLGKTIIPYRIDATPLKGAMRVILNQTHWIEAYPDYKTRFKELVAVVAQTLGITISTTESAPDATEESETSAKPNKAKRYWWVVLCLLALGVAIWRLLPDINIDSKVNNHLLDLSDSEFVYFKENGRYGYKLKSTGEVVIPLKYGDAYPFRDGLAVVELDDKWGFIDKTDKVIIPLMYDYAVDFREGLAPVTLNGKWGYIDNNGKEIIALKYDWAGSFIEDLASVKLNGKYGWIDKTGKEVIPLKYDQIDVVQFFNEGLAKVSLNDKWGFIDKTGKEVISLKYDFAGSFSEGFAKIRRINGKWGFIDKTGKEITPLKYNDVLSFSEGLAAVGLDGKWGFINTMGKEVIPLKYDYAEFFSGGKALVELNGETFYIDKNGHRVK